MRRSVVAALVAAVGLLAAGCAQPPAVAATQQLGSPGSTTIVLVDRGFDAHARATFSAFLHARPGYVRWGAGDPATIATSVKQGDEADAVIIRSGPQLDRIRDEFVLPPEQIGQIGGVTYWVGGLDGRGWALLTYLTGIPGRRTLRTQGVTLPPPLPS